MKQKTDKGIRTHLDELVGLRLHVLRHPKRNAARRSQNLLMGDSSSRLLGRGMDFAEFRVYQPGNDDIRCIDWNVTARTGTPHVRVYQQEKERPVFIIVDQSESMQFATRIAFKSVLAARLAALLAWHANIQGDRVGGMICGIEQAIELKPRGGKQGVLHLLRELANQHSIVSQVNWQQRLLHLRHVVRPGSLIYILSDFYQCGTEIQTQLQYLAQHNEVVLGWISDPLEQQAPPNNCYTFSDGQRRLRLDTSNLSLCQDYAAMFKQHQDNLIQLCHRSRIHYVPISTAYEATDYIGDLLQPKRQVICH